MHTVSGVERTGEGADGERAKGHGKYEYVHGDSVNF